MRGGVCQLPAAVCPTAGAASLGPVRAQQAEVLTDRLVVTGSLDPAGGFSGPAVPFRTLPVTPVVGPRLAIANGRLLPCHLTVLRGLPSLP